MDDGIDVTATDPQSTQSSVSAEAINAELDNALAGLSEFDAALAEEASIAEIAEAVDSTPGISGATATEDVTPGISGATATEDVTPGISGATSVSNPTPLSPWSDPHIQSSIHNSSTFIGPFAIEEKSLLEKVMETDQEPLAGGGGGGAMQENMQRRTIEEIIGSSSLKQSNALNSKESIQSNHVLSANATEILNGILSTHTQETSLNETPMADQSMSDQSMDDFGAEQ